MQRLYTTQRAYRYSITHRCRGRSITRPRKCRFRWDGKGISPELVLCSASRRTRQTLTRIAPGLGKSANVRIEPELYATSAAVLLEVLHEVPDEVESVMLIGHNPGIQDLALSLASAGSEIPRLRSKFRTAVLATLELNGTWRWHPGGRAEEKYVLRPRGHFEVGTKTPSGRMPGTSNRTRPAGLSPTASVEAPCLGIRPRAVPALWCDVSGARKHVRSDPELRPVQLLRALGVVGIGVRTGNPDLAADTPENGRRIESVEQKARPRLRHAIGSRRRHQQQAIDPVLTAELPSDPKPQ